MLFRSGLELGLKLGRTEMLGLPLGFSDGLELGLRLGRTEMLGLPLGFSDGLELGLRLVVRVVGFAVGVFVVGFAVDGLRVLGLRVVGFAVDGLHLLGLCIVGFAVDGLRVLGLRVVGFLSAELEETKTGVQSQRCPCSSQRVIWDTETLHMKRLHSTHQQLLKEAAPEN